MCVCVCACVWVDMPRVSCVLTHISTRNAFTYVHRHSASPVHTRVRTVRARVCTMWTQSAPCVGREGYDCCGTDTRVPAFRKDTVLQYGSHRSKLITKAPPAAHTWTASIGVATTSSSSSSKLTLPRKIDHTNHDCPPPQQHAKLEKSHTVCLSLGEIEFV